MHRVFAVFTEDEFGEWRMHALFKRQKDADKYARDWMEKPLRYREAKVEVWEVN